jgi:hypothetical protein
MAKVQILLAPHEVMREIFLSKEKLEMVREALPRYSDAGTYEFTQEGQAAAEEAFDLTNNPSRDEERADLYGHDRSVSSGDVVDVDGVKYVCMSIGWEVLPK